MLYIVGTPIGNLGDISKRVSDILSQADIIFAEDTRSALNLLNSQNIKKPIKSCHKDNESKTVEEILSFAAKNKTVLMSEAGMPCISDPGALVVKKAIEQGVPFEIAQGPTALIHAVIASGFCGGGFHFHGFLPRKENEKKKELERLKRIPAPIIFYESPHRLKDTLRLILKNFPRPIAVTREATKLHEETLFIYEESDIENITVKGEFVIVADNGGAETKEKGLECDYEKIAGELLKEGISAKDILKMMKAIGMKRNDAYSLINKLQK